MSKLDCVHQIKEKANGKEIAELLGIQLKQMGTNFSMLCPKHDDRHFGSCFVTDFGFKCFSCQESGDVFDLVMTHMGCDFTTAKHFLAEHYGIPIKKQKRKKTSAQTLNKEELILIGLKPTKSKIEHIVGIYSEEEYSPEILKENESAEWHPHINENGVFSGYYLIKTVVDSNPLLTLSSQNYNLYKQMVFYKACETLKKYREMKNTFETLSTVFSEARLFVSVTKQSMDKCLKIAKQFDSMHKRSYSA